VAALLSVLRELRRWDEKPSREDIEKARAGVQWHDCSASAGRFTDYMVSFRGFRQSWLEARRGDYTRAGYLRETWFYYGQNMKDATDGHDEVRGFRRDYEDFVRRKLRLPATALPNTTCIDHVLRAFGETVDAMRSMEALQRACSRASTLLTLCSSIVYTVARLMIMALLFTSLRAVPAGVYEDTPWTRFLPSIS
jgi:hypothetical protein